jgi:hypothetical protein
MKFGLLKSKIENVLIESYKKNTFKEEMKIFKKLVIENKNISKLLFLYDELSSPKGLEESIASEFMLESIIRYENLINKIEPKKLNELQSWVSKVTCENKYNDIDNLFSQEVVDFDIRLKSKKTIKEGLKSIPTTKKSEIKLPLSTMVNVANRTISNYIETLEESDKKELINLLSSDSADLEKEFEQIKEDVVKKLTTLKESVEDDETKTKVDETLEKINSEKFDKLSYFKLKNLKETL